MPDFQKTGTLKLIRVKETKEPTRYTEKLTAERDRWARNGKNKGAVKKCHFCPQAYLRQVIGGHQVHVVAKLAERIPLFFETPVRPEDVCMEIDLYSQERSDGTWDRATLEHHFEFLENKWSSLAQRLEDAAISGYEQYLAATFITELVFRNPRAVKGVERPTGEVTEILLRRVPQMAEALLEKPWYAMRSERGFITSDYPVLFTWRWLEEQPGRNAGQHVVLPITRHTAVVIGDPAGMGDVNDHIWSMATSYILVPEDVNCGPVVATTEPFTKWRERRGWEDPRLLRLAKDFEAQSNGD